MFDDGYWPSFTSGKARSTHAAWDQVGEGFVKELDFSRIWLRINANDSSNEKDDIVAEFKCDTKDFLEQCFVRLLFLSTPFTYFLSFPSPHLIYNERVKTDDRTNLPISYYHKQMEVIAQSSV
jgi:Ca2+-dependent lipid-binding protein